MIKKNQQYKDSLHNDMMSSNSVRSENEDIIRKDERKRTKEKLKAHLEQNQKELEEQLHKEY